MTIPRFFAKGIARARSNWMPFQAQIETARARARFSEKLLQLSNNRASQYSSRISHLQTEKNKEGGAANAFFFQPRKPDSKRSRSPETVRSITPTGLINLRLSLRLEIVTPRLTSLLSYSTSGLSPNPRYLGIDISDIALSLGLPCPLSPLPDGRRVTVRPSRG